MGRITFVTGPVRSGKSRFALDLARSHGEVGVFLAGCPLSLKGREAGR